MVIIVITGAGAILAKIRRSITLAGGAPDIQRQLDALVKRDAELAEQLDQIKNTTASTNVRVAEMHGAVMAMVTLRQK